MHVMIPGNLLCSSPGLALEGENWANLTANNIDSHEPPAAVANENSCFLQL